MPKSIFGWVLPSKDEISHMNLDALEKQLQLATKAKRDVRKDGRYQNKQIVKRLIKNGHRCVLSKLDPNGEIPKIMWCGMNGACVGKRCGCGRLHRGIIRCNMIWPMKIF